MGKVSFSTPIKLAMHKSVFLCQMASVTSPMQRSTHPESQAAMSPKPTTVLETLPSLLVSDGPTWPKRWSGLPHHRHTIMTSKHEINPHCHQNQKWLKASRRILLILLMILRTISYNQLRQSNRLKLSAQFNERNLELQQMMISCL